MRGFQKLHVRRFWKEEHSRQKYDIPDHLQSNGETPRCRVVDRVTSKFKQVTQKYARLTGVNECSDEGWRLHKPRDNLDLIDDQDRTTNSFRCRFPDVQGHNSWIDVIRFTKSHPDISTNLTMNQHLNLQYNALWPTEQESMSCQFG
jgi:hypothetical protein